MGTLFDLIIREQIEEFASHGSTAAIRRRAQLLLLYDEGLPTVEVAEQVSLSQNRTRYWRRRYLSEGMDIFAESPPDNKPTSEVAPETHLLSESLVEESVPDEQILESTEQIGSQPVSLDDLRQRYPANLRQAEHRRDLALALFDGTQLVHQLPSEHRRLLEVAALLQYLTESQEEEKSNKSGYLFILSNPLTDLTEVENKIVESILEYQHGEVDYLVAGASGEKLPQSEREAFIQAALLRISHGLDTSQSQTTNIESINLDNQELIVRVTGPKSKTDARSAKKSAKLWTNLFGQKARFRAIAPIVPLEEEAFLLAKKRPGVEPDDSLAEAGRKVLAYQFAQMIRHEGGTRLGEDIEDLHDMRVATRRMRAAFEVFAGAFEPKVLKTHLKGLRSTGRALGRVRDLDVFMEKALRYLETIPAEERQGLQPLLSLWEKEREQARDKMLEHLESEDYTDFKRKFANFLTTTGAGAKPISPSSPHLVRHVAPVLIYTRMASVRAFDSILTSATITQLHGLRIEFKKLRYTLEFFREVLGEGINELISEIKTIQDHLGDLNDADVACQILRDFLDDWESRQIYKPISERDNPEPIVAYLATKHAERYFLTTTFQDVWQDFEQPETHEKLAVAVGIL